MQQLVSRAVVLELLVFLQGLLLVVPNLGCLLRLHFGSFVLIDLHLVVFLIFPFVTHLIIVVSLHDVLFLKFILLRILKFKVFSSDGATCFGLPLRLDNLSLAELFGVIGGVSNLSAG